VWSLDKLVAFTLSIFTDQVNLLLLGLHELDVTAVHAATGNRMGAAGTLLRLGLLSVGVLKNGIVRVEFLLLQRYLSAAVVGVAHIRRHML
jgi:hypothetical protein